MSIDKLSDELTQKLGNLEALLDNLERNKSQKDEVLKAGRAVL